MMKNTHHNLYGMLHFGVWLCLELICLQADLSQQPYLTEVKGSEVEEVIIPPNSFEPTKPLLC